MVNYGRVVCEVALLATLAALAVAAPTNCKDGHYDQRQNGTENIRVHVDGVVLAVMPAESLAESLLDVLPDINSIIDSDDFTELYQKPKPPPSTELTPPPAPHKPIVKPSATPEKPASSYMPEKPAVIDVPEKPAASDASEKPAAVDLPATPAEAPLSDVSMNSDIKSQKKEATLTKQKKAQRVKNFLASVLMPLLRKNRHH